MSRVVKHTKHISFVRYRVSIQYILIPFSIKYIYLLNLSLHIHIYKKITHNVIKHFACNV